MTGIPGYIVLTIVSIMPALLCAGFYFLDAKTKFKELGYWKRQIVFGVAFGLVSVAATPLSLNYSEGILINVRDAAVVVVGLFFGAPAGIIAGFMGGSYRFVSVYWGGSGAYTQLACSISTFVSGIFAATVHQFIFQNKKISWFGAFFTGVVAETFHMLMIFLTHMGDVGKAYSIVKGLGLIMVTFNAFAVLLASIMRIVLYHEKVFGWHKSIHRQIGVRLFITILSASALTTTFTYFIFSQLSYASAESSMSTALDDVYATVESSGNEKLLSLTKQIAGEIKEASEVNNDYLVTLSTKYSVTEINYIPDGHYIAASTNPDYVGFSMYGDVRGNSYQSEFFMENVISKGEYVQKYGESSSGVYRKYAGVKDGDVIIQVGYDAEAFHSSIAIELDAATSNRHVGQSGYIVLANQEKTILNGELEGKDLLGVGFAVSERGNEKPKRVSVSGGELLFSYRVEEGFYLIAVIPMEEISYNRDLSALVTVYTEAIIFSVLFMIVYSLIERFIIRNIDKVNASLIKISGGDLNEIVDVQDSKEFAYLSRDINQTVAVLKSYTEAEKDRVAKELSFAQSIQNSSMPNVFPPFPGRKDIDIYAGMKAAKMVGGDFYDFYFLPNGRLLFLVADVSNKGVPAAMFMMQTKATIKSLAETGIPVESVMEKANKKLCEGNDASMFVTVWLATLDLTNGLLRYVSAGHNPVLYRHESGEYEYLRGKRGFVLAGFDDVKYQANEVHLSPGDQLFLYTDGVSEAKNVSEEFYGEERLKNTVNRALKANPDELVKAVKKDLDEFVGEAEQFDDITMLSLRMNSYQGNNVLHTMVRPGVTDEAINYLETRLRKNSFQEKTIHKVNIITDEIVSNIAKYSGAVYCEVSMVYSPKGLTLEYVDDGAPYNPLEEKEPDTTLPAEEREIGGLGLFMVRKMCKQMTYERRGNNNVLHVTIDYEK